jgi:hypothetical protein
MVEHYAVPRVIVVSPVAPRPPTAHSDHGHEVIVAHARHVRLIGESRKRDDHMDARTLGEIGADRSAVAGAGEAPRCTSTCDGDPTASRAGADGVNQYGTRTDEVLQRAAARLQLEEWGRAHPSQA